MGLFTRAIRPPPPDDIEPNENELAANPPGTVGPTAYTPGDPDGVVLDTAPAAYSGPPPTITPSAWSGWPASWWPPAWNGLDRESMSETVFVCLDINTGAIGTMPPYLVNAPPSLDAGWLTNPNPEVYGCWEAFARELWWDFQLAGEAFVIADSRYSTGWPARFHVVPPWTVNVEMRAGRRHYTIGDMDVTADMLHIPYKTNVSDAHGHGALEYGRYRVVAVDALTSYVTNLVGNGGIPTSILQHPEELTAEQTASLKTQWLTARASGIGEPAVLSGGVTWEPVQLDPEKMSLLELQKHHESRIAVMLRVKPEMIGLPSGGDSLTYSTIESIYDHHWRGHLRPLAQIVMSHLSGWLLPRGVRVELNSDKYTQPGPYERAQTDQILAGIVDAATGQQAKTVAEIRAQERFTAPPAELAEGVLR